MRPIRLLRAKPCDGPIIPSAHRMPSVILVFARQRGCSGQDVGHGIVLSTDGKPSALVEYKREIVRHCRHPRFEAPAKLRGEIGACRWQRAKRLVKLCAQAELWQNERRIAAEGEPIARIDAGDPFLVNLILEEHADLLPSFARDRRVVSHVPAEHVRERLPPLAVPPRASPRCRHAFHGDRLLAHSAPGTGPPLEKRLLLCAGGGVAPQYAGAQHVLAGDGAAAHLVATVDRLTTIAPVFL